MRWIDQIANDRVSGASALAERAAELLAIVPRDELKATAEAVIRAQPAMASVYNAAQAAMEGRIEEFLQLLRRSSEVIAARARELVRGKIVLTHSFSSTVLRTLKENSPARVVCTESLPGGEGRKLAQQLAGAEVVPDAAIYTALAHADLAIVGADAITPNAVINKLGTALVAVAARELGKPVWVLCGTEKLVGSEWTPDLGDMFEATPMAWFTGIVNGA